MGITIEELLRKIDELVGYCCDCNGEATTMNALAEHSESWRMRAQELNGEDE